MYSARACATASGVGMDLRARFLLLSFLLPRSRCRRTARMKKTETRQLRRSFGTPDGEALTSSSVKGKPEIRNNDYAFLRLTNSSFKNTGDGVIRAVDLFCGCGGISLGLREACAKLGKPFQVALAIDLLPAACNCFRVNFPEASVVEADISRLLTLDFGKRPRKTERDCFGSLGSIDILVGGPPCQGHSDLNNYTRRNDPKNQLYLYMLRAAELIRPKHIIIENVMGAAHDKNHVVQTVRDNLGRLGYKVSLGSIFMPDIGVPQTRRRLLIVATKGKEFSFDSVPISSTFKSRDLKWAIGDLEDVESEYLIDQAASPTPDCRRRIEYLFEHDLFDLPNSERPPCHQDGKHSYISIYGRLHWDRPSQTITRGFFNMSMGRYVHPSQRRTLTAHEAARLQFFPDYFDFSSVKARTDLATLIGNAVPSKLPYLIGLELLHD